MIDFRGGHESHNWADLFCDKNNRRSFCICFGLIMGHQFSGIIAIISYADHIFEEAHISVEPALAAIFMGFVSLSAKLLAALLVDKVGRRILLLVSYFLSIICFMLMGITFVLKDNLPHLFESLRILPVVIMCLITFVIAVGIFPVAFVMMGEIFDQKVKGMAVGIITSSNFAFSMFVTMLFPLLNVSIGAGSTFFVFSMFLAISFLFVLFCVPETKGKSFEEIQQMLSKRK